MSLHDARIDVLARAMDATALRHRVTAANIANVNTPNYRAKTLRFEDAFRQALKSGDEKGALSTTAEIVEREDAATKSDGNSVHLEHEFGVLQKNKMMFDVYSNVLRHKLQLMKRAIAGR